MALLLYWIVPESLKNALLLFISLTFYAWGAPLLLLPMLLIIVVNYIQGRRLEGATNPLYKKRVVKVTAVLNIAVMLLTLYFDRAANAIAVWFDLAPLSFQVPTPLGVSFFTLQAMTYVFEIARGKVRPDRNIINVGLFIAFFPTVLFGPILRYTDLAEQIRHRRASLASFGSGWQRCVFGLAKLLILAAPLHAVAMDIFATSALRDLMGSTPVVLAWLGLLAFFLQFYLAFSGYSDIAIGLSRMFGFSVKENFNYPYAATSVTGFWERWNISLYRWFYLYVFILLGGRRPKRVIIKRVLKPKNYAMRNYFAMWMLIGLWHGISWNMLAFGFWFFLIALFEWITSLNKRQRKTWKSSCFYVLPVVAIGWVFLATRNFPDSLAYLSNLLGINNNGFYAGMVAVYAREYWHIIILGILACTPLAKWMRARVESRQYGLPKYFFALCHVLLLLGLTYLCCIYANELPKVPLIKFNQALM